MELTGSHRFPAPREAVWSALNDPEVLRRSIPGCKELNKLSDTEFEARIFAKTGPVKATFQGTVTLSEFDPPKGYRISGTLRGRAGGFARRGADIALKDDTEGTLLEHVAATDVGGKLAGIGTTWYRASSG